MGEADADNNNNNDNIISYKSSSNGAELESNGIISEFMFNKMKTNADFA